MFGCIVICRHMVIIAAAPGSVLCSIGDNYVQRSETIRVLLPSSRNNMEMFDGDESPI